eukprot:CAMPEP_0115842352 /NCGR_PEP_ID=MMETSP0287-20121206/7757_1 /TAXON_ID=412157 /ORGANISM="Chrysochromulina rotalis, Strain UIO044" /LENGTH=126 /DNA_ID=CAMNT_0003296021 /DNA_START=243 /DNA_END=623 /DNA_ORIENTATION=-
MQVAAGRCRPLQAAGGRYRPLAAVRPCRCERECETAERPLTGCTLVALCAVVHDSRVEEPYRGSVLELSAGGASTSSMRGREDRELPPPQREVEEIVPMALGSSRSMPALALTSPSRETSVRPVLM